MLFTHHVNRWTAAGVVGAVDHGWFIQDRVRVVAVVLVSPEDRQLRKLGISFDNDDVVVMVAVRDLVVKMAQVINIRDQQLLSYSTRS